jgi:hypothetical protein
LTTRCGSSFEKKSNAFNAPAISRSGALIRIQLARFREIRRLLENDRFRTAAFMEWRAVTTKRAPPRPNAAALIRALAEPAILEMSGGILKDLLLIPLRSGRASFAT